MPIHRQWRAWSWWWCLMEKREGEAREQFGRGSISAAVVWSGGWERGFGVGWGWNCKPKLISKLATILGFEWDQEFGRRRRDPFCDHVHTTPCSNTARVGSPVSAIGLVSNLLYTHGCRRRWAGIYVESEGTMWAKAKQALWGDVVKSKCAHGKLMWLCDFGTAETPRARRVLTIFPLNPFSISITAVVVRRRATSQLFALGASIDRLWPLPTCVSSTKISFPRQPSILVGVDSSSILLTDVDHGLPTRKRISFQSSSPELSVPIGRKFDSAQLSFF